MSTYRPLSYFKRKPRRREARSKFGTRVNRYDTYTNAELNEAWRTMRMKLDAMPPMPDRMVCAVQYEIEQITSAKNWN